MKNALILTAIKATTLTIAFCSTQVLAESATAGSYKIDPAHTSVHFTVSHLGISNLAGRFNSVEGSITLVPNGNSKVEVIIQTNSIDTNHKKRDTHLRSPDFFNSNEYPDIKFSSDQLSYNKKGEPVSITGKLHMLGKSQTVTLDVTPVGAGNDPWGGYRAGYDATTNIKRSEFGMNFMPGGIGDDINIFLNIEAIKQ